MTFPYPLQGIIYGPSPAEFRLGKARFFKPAGAQLAGIQELLKSFRQENGSYHKADEARSLGTAGLNDPSKHGFHV